MKYLLTIRLDGVFAYYEFPASSQIVAKLRWQEALDLVDAADSGSFATLRLVAGSALSRRNQ